MNTFRLKRNLDEAVYEQILSGIFEGKFHSGEQVQIERLCEQYEISRTPVIQALKRLATDGIVETSPTGKFFFPAADERRVRDMMEMRLFFEVGAANLICDIGEPAMDYRIAAQRKSCITPWSCAARISAAGWSGIRTTRAGTARATARALTCRAAA